jgi:coenzyme PQQ precursor peptide PqqA
VLIAGIKQKRKAGEENEMNQSTECPDNTKSVWETPIFQEIPISFEASSYALTEDDPLYR